MSVNTCFSWPKGRALTKKDDPVPISSAFRCPRSLQILPIIAALVLMLAPVGAQAYELVMFDKAGCVWCARWEREVGYNYASTDEARIAPLRRADIRDQDRIGLDLVEPITYTPTFVLSDRGVEIGRITGYQGEETFWGTLDGMLRDDRQPRR